VTLPQSKSSQYADDVVAFNTTEFHLRQIIKDLDCSLKSRPNDADALMILGMALCRVGRLDDGINKMKYSVHLSPDKIGINNLVISLATNCKYKEAWDVIINHNLEISLFDAALCGCYEKTEGVFDEQFHDALTEISRLMLKITPYGSRYEVELDEEDGQKIIDIKA